MCGDDKAIKDAVKFFKTIGMKWINAEYLSDMQNEIDIELIDMPDILKTFCLQCDPVITNISALGISFYLAIMPLKDSKGVLISERGNIDGVVFCPMSNVKVIHTFGGLRFVEHKKIKLLKGLNS
jgi:hypothetical protein